MFRKEYQKGFISIFAGSGATPLKIWDVKTENGCIERVMDEELKSSVLEITGCNVSTTYITCPKNKEDTLGIKMPFCTLNWKNILKYFVIEITIKDDKNIHRRFRFSDFLHKPHRRSTFFAVCPIKKLPDGWKQLKFNLCDMTKKGFDSCYVETVRVQINANCRLKGIYFSDILYDDDDIPNEYRLIRISQPRKTYIPFQNKRKPSKLKRPSTPDSVVPWIQGLKGTEENEYDRPHPSVASSDEDEGDTYNLGSNKDLLDFDREDVDDEYEEQVSETIKEPEDVETEEEPEVAESKKEPEDVEMMKIV